MSRDAAKERYSWAPPFLSSGWGTSSSSRRPVVLQRLEATAGPEVEKLGLVFSTLPPAASLPVTKVREGMWAEGQGIQCGSCVVEVNGLPVLDLTAEVFTRLMQGRPLRLLVEVHSESSEDENLEDDVNRRMRSGRSSGEISQISEVSLRSARDFEAAPSVAHLGLTFGKLPPVDKLRIKKVQESSWAWERALCPGDLIVAVNGQSVSDMTGETFVKMMKTRPLFLRIKEEVGHSSDDDEGSYVDESEDEQVERPAVDSSGQGVRSASLEDDLEDEHVRRQHVADSDNEDVRSATAEDDVRQSRVADSGDDTLIRSPEEDQQKTNLLVAPSCSAQAETYRLSLTSAPDFDSKGRRRHSIGDSYDALDHSYCRQDSNCSTGIASSVVKVATLMQEIDLEEKEFLSSSKVPLLA